MLEIKWKLFFKIQTWFSWIISRLTKHKIKNCRTGVPNVKKISFIVDTWKDCLCYFTTKHFHHAHNLLLPTTHHHHHQENHQMHLNAVDNFITPAYNLPEAANILSEADHKSSWLCLKWFDLILSWPISFLSRQQTYPPWANTVPILHTPPPNYQWKSTEHLSSPW